MDCKNGLTWCCGPTRTPGPGQVFQVCETCAHPVAAVGGKRSCGRCHSFVPYGARHICGAIDTTGKLIAPPPPKGPMLEAYACEDCEDNALEAARLRKELEAAKRDAEAYKAQGIAAIEQIDKSCEGCGQVEKLRAFSEDQARQIQLLETERGMWRATQEMDAHTIGQLTRELEKLKRGGR